MKKISETFLFTEKKELKLLRKDKPGFTSTNTHTHTMLLNEDEKSSKLCSEDKT